MHILPEYLRISIVGHSCGERQAQIGLYLEHVWSTCLYVHGNQKV